MLVRDFIEVPVPLETAVSAVSDPMVWRRALDSSLGPEDHVVLARFGIQGLLGGPDGTTHIRIGSVSHQPRGTVVDVQWHSGSTDGAPAMQADVTLSALSSQLAHLEFNGCYACVNSLSAAPADRMVQHRVVEFAVRLVLERLVDCVQQSRVGVAG